MTARILDVPEAEYHKLPGLSYSFASTMTSQSPAHAKWNREHGKEATRLMDRGNVIGTLVLGEGKQFRILKHDSYRTNAAKADRDAAVAAELIPILEADHDDALKASAKILVGLSDRGIVLDGKSEVPFEWEERSTHGIVKCRGRADHLWLDRGVILDLKVVSNAAPDAVERSAENFGYAIQEVAYTRALEQLRPEMRGRVQFLFAFCEAVEPYAINVCRSDGVFRELGMRRWAAAVEKYAECEATDVWPAYGDGVNHLSAPAWALKKMLEQEMIDV